ncbi:MAG: glycoside hydrolase family 3 protein [Gemmatimonadetes bacterium]|nr:glycoside hydrolase family 3 protein [Gemmatimonadota bacterium]
MTPVARLVFPALRWRRRTGFDHERLRIERTLELGVGGYIFFGGTADAASALIREIQAAAPHPLLFAADFERGVGQQFTDRTQLPPPAALGFLGKPELTARGGQITACQARQVGINWVYAPVADLDVEPNNPIVQTRSFGDLPDQVGGHVGAWIRAAEAEGVATSAKHYPGHGRTTADSHETLPRVDAPLDILAASDLKPFADGIAAGTRSVMCAHVAYPAWDSSGLPASLSAPVLRHLRTALGFDGVIVTDALIMEGVLRGRGAAGAVVAAVTAGADALLYPQDAEAVVKALDAAAGKALPSARVDDALARIARLAEAVSGPASSAPDLAEDGAFADALADMTLHVLRGEALGLVQPLEVVMVDDDVGGPYAVGPRDLLQRRLAELGVRMGRGGSRILLVYSEPRSWKGRAMLGDRSLGAIRRAAPTTALVILFGHPRLEAQLEGTTPVLCAWHGQPLMQHAAARWVAARLG